MAFDKMSLGSKNPKKTIKVDVTKKHIFYFFGVILLIVLIVYIALINLGFYNVEEMKVSCVNGAEEQVIEGKTYYCGEHYSVLKGSVNDKSYKIMEEIINGTR